MYGQITTEVRIWYQSLGVGTEHVLNSLEEQQILVNQDPSVKLNSLTPLFFELLLVILIKIRLVL